MLKENQEDWALKFAYSDHLKDTNEPIKGFCQEWQSLNKKRPWRCLWLKESFSWYRESICSGDGWDEFSNLPDEIFDLLDFKGFEEWQIKSYSTLEKAINALEKALIKYYQLK